MNTHPVTQGPLRMVSPQLEGLLNAAADGVLILDHKGRIRLMGHAAERMFGYQESDLLGYHVDKLLPGVFQTLNLSFTATDQIMRLEPAIPLQGRRMDGSQFAVELSIGRIFGIEPPRYIAFIRDISERLRREAALAQNEAALNTAQRLANIGNYVIYYDACQPDYASPQLRRMFGWDDQGSISHMLIRMLAAVQPADRERVMRVFAEFDNGEHGIDIEYRIFMANGELRHMHHLAQLQRSATGALEQQVGTVHDITDRKLADFELRNMHDRIAHFGRISIMGEMAAGLAHEINQPLTAIASYARGCQRLMNGAAYEPAEIVGVLEQIAKQALRAGEVIRRLRSFGKYHEAKLAPIDANRLLEDLVQLGQTDAHYHKVRVEMQPANEGLMVFADAVQIQQVLLNLMRNAIDAMLEIPEANREIVLRTRLDERGDVEFMVADRGTGLSQERSEEAFNAFFTTKDHGTGLGLSISQSIIRTHGGKVWCVANPGGGTRFFFCLPRLQSDSFLKYQQS